MKRAMTFGFGLLVGCALGWFVGYVHPSSKAARHAVQYMNRVEPDFVASAIYGLASIPLILSGDTNAAIERLSHPIASYYRLYALDPGTNDYRLRMRRVIDEMARTNPIVANSIQRETKRDGWREVWIDGLGTYASVKVERFSNPAAKDEPEGAANRSQPARSKTNRASPLAGSGR